jgi:hypothetical protein
MKYEFMKQIVFLRSDLYPMEECLQCYHSSIEECHGGCLARRYGHEKVIINLEEDFFKRTPFLSTNFKLGKQNRYNKRKLHNGSERFFLYCEHVGRVEEITKNLFNLLKEVDGSKNIEQIFDSVFSNITDNKITRKIFKNIIITLLERGILSLKPFRVNGMNGIIRC